MFSHRNNIIETKNNKTTTTKSFLDPGLIQNTKQNVPTERLGPGFRDECVETRPSTLRFYTLDISEISVSFYRTFPDTTLSYFSCR